MLPNSVRLAAVSGLAGITAIAGLLSSPSQATETSPPASLNESGELISWGTPATATSRAIPASNENLAFSDVEPTSGYTLALTASGRVIAFGGSLTMTNVPSALQNTTAIDISAHAGRAAAVTAAGKVIAWGSGQSVTALPPGLSDVRSIAMHQDFGFAIKRDGTVVGWGSNSYGVLDLPAGLNSPQEIVLGNRHAIALKADGSVVAWGTNTSGQTDLPASITVPGAVQAVRARSNGGLALLTDGTLASWGDSSQNQPPASVAGKTFVQIDTFGPGLNLAIDDEGAITTWGISTDVPAELSSPPAGATEGPITKLALGAGSAFVLKPAVRPAALPVISGSAKVGQTLRATPPDFSGSPDSVEGQWLANGITIAGATGTTLALTSAHLAKVITFASVATKAGQPTTIISAATAPVSAASPPPPSVSASKTKISKIKAKKTMVTAKVTVTPSPKKPVTGTIKVVIKRGSKTVASTTVKVASNGTATFTSKKLKAKQRKALAKKGKYKMTASYSGARYIKKSTATVSFRVR